MQIHPRQILWPTDFSALSFQATPYVKAFCEAFDASLHVIHVAVPVSPDGASSRFMAGGDLLAATTDVLQERKEALRLLVKRRFARLTVAPHVITGNAWQEICRYAPREEIDLIILATHGVTGLKHLLMGSTAERVVQHAPCPVLTVKSFEREFVEQEPVPARVKIIQSTVGEYAVNPGPTESAANV